jgi:hypothetical protein
MRREIVLSAIFAIIAISGCTGTQNSVNANWCPVGSTTTTNVGSGTMTWNYRSVESYVFPDGTVSLCCMEGHLVSTNENSWTRMCVDNQGKHSVQWKSQTGNDYVKFAETYPNGTQTCIKTFNSLGNEDAENCQ